MAVTIGLEADAQYRDALAMLARQKNKTVARLVREALDQAHGDEIAKRLSFFAPHVLQNQQSVNQSTPVAKHKRKAAQP